MSSGTVLVKREVMQKTAPLALSTRIKDGLNAVLKIAGLQLGTTREQNQETVRLRQLVERGQWSAPRYSSGLRLAPDHYHEFLDTVCSSYRPNFPERPPEAASGNEAFYLNNGWFESVDAEVLYSIIRRFKPAHIVEVGSGFSTRAMRRAILDGSLHTRLTSIDPIPRVDVASFADEEIRTPVETLEVSRLVELLQSNDILFIDSSHLITTGGDVTFLCLEVIPALRPGVFVHFHDIFLPFEYPRAWVVDSRCRWNEQYLVQAFLHNNSEYEIVWPAHYMWTQYKGEVLKAIAYDPARSSPSSFWIRKIG
jgi:predicted O-methyltransferase YrrM